MGKRSKEPNVGRRRPMIQLGSNSWKSSELFIYFLLSCYYFLFSSIFENLLLYIHSAIISVKCLLYKCNCYKSLETGGDSKMSVLGIKSHPPTLIDHLLKSFNDV